MTRPEHGGGGLAACIEHTNLKPTASEAEIVRLCAEAREHGFAAVCVNGGRIGLVACELAGTTVRPCAVVGFPLGAMASAVKAVEAEHAVAQGACEIDMVLALGPFLEGDAAAARSDIEAVVRACGVPVKVILETGYLGAGGIRRACGVAREAGAAFVKTSTGFGPRGASVEDVRIMRAAVGADLQIKASGGIRTQADAQALVAAGATRLGTSAGIAIVTGAVGP